MVIKVAMGSWGSPKVVNAGVGRWRVMEGAFIMAMREWDWVDEVTRGGKYVFVRGRILVMKIVGIVDRR